MAVKTAEVTVDALEHMLEHDDPGFGHRVSSHDDDSGNEVEEGKEKGDGPSVLLELVPLLLRLSRPCPRWNESWRLMRAFSSTSNCA